MEELQVQTTAILSGAKATLETNQASVAKAKGVAVQLIEQIDSTIIKDAPNVKHLDEQCKGFLSKITKSIIAMNDRRKPITQAFDQMKKLFTSLENEMKGCEEIAKIKDFRNKFAQHLAAEEARKEAETARVAAIQQEKIDIRASIKKAYTDDLVATIDIVFTELEEIFKAITISNAYAKKAELKNFSQSYKPCTPQCQFQYITEKEFIEISDVVSPTSIDVNTLEYSKAVTEKKQYYLDRVDSKIAELVKISEANQAEKVKLEADRKEREQKESEQKKADLLAFSKKQTIAIEAEKAEASVVNLFEQNYAPPAANVKKTLTIEVLNNAAYAQIYIFWYEREGKNMTPDKFEKVTVARMKKFCEDIANKEGEVIDSQLLIYNEVVTAK